MASIVQSNATATVEIVSDDRLYVAADISIVTFTGDAIFNISNGMTGGVIYNYGAVVALGGAGVDYDGDGGTVYNYGDIAGHLYGVDISGDNTRLSNSGTITGSGGGIYAGTAAGAIIENHGTIVSSTQNGINIVSSTGVSVQNHGVLSGGGIVSQGSSGAIYNGGLINATLAGYAINLSANSSTAMSTVNRGEIQGATGSYLGGAMGEVLSNHGTMYGALNMAAGNDTLINRGYLDGTISLGAGHDVFRGVGGTISGPVQGGSGDDTFYIDDAGIVIVEAIGEGVDLVGSMSTYALGDNIENLTLLGGTQINGYGNGLANSILGNNAANTLDGGGGDDIISAGWGDDRVLGGAGSDLLYGEGGDDLIGGGAGQDALYGGDGNDRLFGAQEADLITGGNGDDQIDGGAGADMLNGNDGADTLCGGRGDDVLSGGNDDDILTGDEGADTMTGGMGADVFDFNVVRDSVQGIRDTILDFVSGEDRIDLSTIDANTTLAGDQDFSFIGSAAFSQAGQVRFVANAVNGFLVTDTNGDGLTDLVVLLPGISSMSVTDFIL